ncbi:ABC transporter permease [Paenibacillus sp. GCM10027628]|uniref:ABC transporter permease n=1 Tax=Paenibacillus sp. GCM10027628 TaxID=3273413 RepID=UPI0036372A3C
MSTAVNLLRFVWTCWKLNLAGAMEFRMSFLMTAGMMMLNNLVWIFFWGLYFNRFPVINGWELRDVMMMWAIGAGGYGLSAVFFGNVYMLASLIANGQLDAYLAQPKPVLLHVLISRMSMTAIGDVLFGLLIFVYIGDFTIIHILKFIASLILSMLIFLFLNLIVQCLAFYIGNAEGIAGQFFISTVTLSTYPTDIFRGVARVLLFTAIPAGFISYMPIGFMRHMNPWFAAGLIIAVCVLSTVGIIVFRRGLRRYSSGNMMSMRM